MSAEEFIKDCTRTCSNKMESPLYVNPKLNFYPWLTPDEALRAVEIAREDIMEKVCRFLDGYAFIPTYVINDLKKAMKDE